MKVAVVQPHYLPWIGYMALMDSVDVFVFYNDVQFSRQSWQQRNKIKLNSGEIHWLTVPVLSGKQHLRIKDMQINISDNWRRKHWDTIEQNYSKCPHFEPYSWYIEDLYASRWFYLADLTIYYTRILARLLNVKMPKTYLSSEFDLQGHKTDRLIMLLKQLEATEYISSLGAKSYIEEYQFKQANIKLTWFDYKHPQYPQKGKEFIPYLSAIDLLFNTGEDAINYIRQGVTL